MKTLTYKKIILFSIVSSIVVSIIFIKLTPMVFSSKSQIALLRIKVENPDSGFDESKNRWIWIRDGLNIKSTIITDEVFYSIIKNQPTAAEIKPYLKSKDQPLEYIKKLITIQYTGADENNFIVEVKAPSAKLAQTLNSVIFNRIKYLSIGSDQEKFIELIEELKKIQVQFKPNSESYLYYADKIRKLNFNHTLVQKQRESSFVVIANPTYNNIYIWPNEKIIIFTFVLIGLTIGNIFYYLIKNGLLKK